MKEKLNTQKGITLIALIISIIVMLILAAVSINIIINQGIITKSKTASDKYNQKAEEEQENLTSWEQLIEQYGGTDTTVPQELKAYLLGKNLAEMMNIENMTFKDDPNTISDASTSVIFKNEMSLGSDLNYAYIFIQYNNSIYKIRYEIKSEEEFIASSFVSVYAPQGREGKQITYNGKEYTVLYDNGDTVEMITNEAIGGYTLGYDDPNATGNNNFEKAVNSYNNAIERLNAYCASFYEGDNNIISVRSVGSDPTNPANENSTLYTDENISTWECEGCNTNGIVKVDKVGKSQDNNWEKDIDRLFLLAKIQADSDRDGYIGCYPGAYWLATRLVNVYSDFVKFGIGLVNTYGFSGDSDTLWEARNDGMASEYTNTLQVRPVVKIKTSALNLE